MALYQDIMKVPGLTGTWQQRNKQLYEKLGSPLGAYKGNYDQNIMLLNKIKSNDYYKSGLPGTTNTGSSGGPHEQIANDSTKGLNPDDRIYHEDIMPQEAWYSDFDEWTRNYVNTYMRPEWEKETYNPAMKKMTQDIGQANQQAGTSGAWRTTMGRQSLADMAKQMTQQEEKMRQGFQDKSVEMRDAIRTNLADPLYIANMKRWGDAPWRGMDTEGLNLEGLGSDLNLGGNNLNDLITDIGNWEPNPDVDVPQYDWTVQPDSPWYDSEAGRGITPDYIGY